MRRIEDKIAINKEKKVTFLDWLKQKDARILFEDRQINSIYFENHSLSIYNESIEGLCPRKKIRVRYYGNKEFCLTNKLNYNLEIKYTDFFGRKKKSEKVKNIKKLLKNGFFDEKYGICRPIISVSYKRKYFLCKGFRVTLDSDIFYKKYNPILFFNSNKILDNNIIVEIKSNNIFNRDQIEAEFPFARTRFSKYCFGIEAFKIIDNLN